MSLFKTNKCYILIAEQCEKTTERFFTKKKDWGEGERQERRLQAKGSTKSSKFFRPFSEHTGPSCSIGSAVQVYLNQKMDCVQMHRKPRRKSSQINLNVRRLTVKRSERMFIWQEVQNIWWWWCWLKGVARRKAAGMATRLPLKIQQSDGMHKESSNSRGL